MLAVVPYCLRGNVFGIRVFLGCRGFGGGSLPLFIELMFER